MTLSAGVRLGPYEIVAPLGAGGMGEVYQARDTRLDRTVAIKVLPEQFASDPQFRERFEREARAVSSLDHPNICALYDVGESAGRAFLVMQFLEGETLATKRGLSVSETVDIARQIALGLEAAHERGVVHRDLKPANIFLTRDGTAKILDFGLAKAAGLSAEARSAKANGAGGIEALSMSPTVMGGTIAGVILGTAAYMSPEQARGLPVDKRADIWAFGCVVYEMLTRRQAFHGATVTDIIAAIVTRDPDWTLLPPDTPSHVRRLLLRCLQKDPRQRLHDIADARLELQDTSPADPVAVAPVVPRRSRSWLPAAIAAAAALAIGVTAGRAWRPAIPAAEQWIGTRLGGPAHVEVPRVSPDGQLLAFLTLVDGQSQVAVMKPTSGNWTIVTRERRRGLSNALAWSTDGARLYYDRKTDAPQGVYSVPALGGEERLVLENASSPWAMADGTLLVQRINENRESQFFRFWPGTGRLDALPAVTTLTDSPMISLPNGREAAFFGQPTNPRAATGLYVLEIDSGRARPVAQAVPFVFPSDQSRAPLAIGSDGSILFGHRRGDAIQLLSFPGGGGTVTPVLTFPVQTALDLARDGSLYVTLRERPVELVWTDARGGTPQRIVPSPMFASGAIAPLPDGRALITSSAAGRSRVLAVTPGREPAPFLETDEETDGPMTAVGTGMAALVIGRPPSREIAIVSVSSGRVIRRLRGSVANATTLAASPDGSTLYYSAAGSIWAAAVDGGTERKICPGDSVTVDPDSGDLIVKLDEPQRFRLQRVRPNGSDIRDVEMGTEIRLAARHLSPGAVKNGRLLFSAATDDSWYWFVGMLDLATGRVSKVPVTYDTDFHLAAWAADGSIVAVGLGVRSTLWRYQLAR